jgi:hypothetical protein
MSDFALLKVIVGSVLGGCLAPVLVDAVLELDNGEVAYFQRQGPVKEDGLSHISSGPTKIFEAVCTCSRG